MEKNIDIKQALFFSFLKNQAYKRKKIINISHLIMVLIKTRLLIFLVLSRYRLTCKYRIISQIPIYNWMQNRIFWYFWYCILIFLEIKLQLIVCLNLLQQVRWVVTCWAESSIISSDSNLTQNIWRITELMVDLDYDFDF